MKHTLTIRTLYRLQQIVYLRTDFEQLPRMITGIKICVDGSILYELTSGTQVTFHYEVEISETKNAFVKCYEA